MRELERIKEHVDGHGVGCVVMDDHVAISFITISHDGEGVESRTEIIHRVKTLQEACEVLECFCHEHRDEKDSSSKPA